MNARQFMFGVWVAYFLHIEMLKWKVFSVKFDKVISCSATCRCNPLQEQWGDQGFEKVWCKYSGTFPLLCISWKYMFYVIIFCHLTHFRPITWFTSINSLKVLVVFTVFLQLVPMLGFYEVPEYEIDSQELDFSDSVQITKVGFLYLHYFDV